MLPNIDVTTAATMGGSAPVTSSARRVETDQLVQEANRALQNLQIQQPQERQSSPSTADRAASTDAVTDSQATEKTQQTGKAGKPGTRTYDRNGNRDQAEINFQLTRDERDVFLNAMSGREDPQEMTEDEQNTLQKVSERLEKLIEEATAKETERVERLERAVKEWYSRLSNGKHKAPADLIRLISQAAMGVVDLSKLE